MIVEQNKPEPRFETVVITLETRKELNGLRLALSGTSPMAVANELRDRLIVIIAGNE